jgi:formylglycine-generating enzyme required for sulfatase activity
MEVPWAEDPLGPSSGQLRVLRGGSWFSTPGSIACRSASSTLRPLGTTATDSGVGKNP